ncbi:hypothetical protein BKA69DRAFT_1042325 [Paraphysoderma sedebokerense]|nr:hypothetical protein BKA69DRAFT_1042325 [Paraphysoderma sedebokerense]
MSTRHSSKNRSKTFPSLNNTSSSTLPPPYSAHVDQTSNNDGRPVSPGAPSQSIRQSSQQLGRSLSAPSFRQMSVGNTASNRRNIGITVDYDLVLDFLTLIRLSTENSAIQTGATAFMSAINPSLGSFVSDNFAVGDTDLVTAIIGICVSVAAVSPKKNNFIRFILSSFSLAATASTGGVPLLFAAGAQILATKDLLSNDKQFQRRYMRLLEKTLPIHPTVNLLDHAVRIAAGLYKNKRLHYEQKKIKSDGLNVFQSVSATVYDIEDYSPFNIASSFVVYGGSYGYQHRVKFLKSQVCMAVVRNVNGEAGKKEMMVFWMDEDNLKKGEKDVFIVASKLDGVVAAFMFVLPLVRGDFEIYPNTSVYHGTDPKDDVLIWA